MINVLCGASIFSKNVLYKYEQKIQYICDADDKKKDSMYNDIPVISYEELFHMLQTEQVHVYLSNRYTSATMKRLETYLPSENLRVYAFLDVELKSATEIKGMMDYYDKSLIIQKVIRANSFIGEQDISEYNQEILIYTPGKVGTMSLRKSMEMLYHQPVMFIHSMRDEESSVNKSAENWVENGWNEHSRRITKIVKQRIAQGKKVKIISMVREPISRNVSMMFYNLINYIHQWTKDNVRITKTSDTYTELFENIFYSLPHQKTYVKWFDNQIKKYLDIDVYQYPMEKEGYCIIKRNNIEVLIIKMEQLNHSEMIIREFLANPEFRLINDNMAEESWYDSIYQEFKKQFVPNKEYIDTVYQSKYMQHFYTQEEIDGFVNKYTKMNNN